jgi:hypothetical protein
VGSTRSTLAEKPSPALRCRWLRAGYTHVTISEVNNELTQQLIAKNIEDTLVMLVRNKRAHLALAQGWPELEAQLSLCKEPLEGGGFGIVDNADIPLLQDLAICPECLSEFTAKHRDRLLTQQAISTAVTAGVGSGGCRALANQIPLF